MSSKDYGNPAIKTRVFMSEVGFFELSESLQTAIIGRMIFKVREHDGAMISDIKLAKLYGFIVSKLLQEANETKGEKQIQRSEG